MTAPHEVTEAQLVAYLERHDWTPKRGLLWTTWSRRVGDWRFGISRELGIDVSRVLDPRRIARLVEDIASIERRPLRDVAADIGAGR